MNAPRATAKIETRDDHIEVQVVWDAPVDRKHTSGYGVRLNETKLAARLARAIDAQVVCLNPTIKTDVNGKTYVSSVDRVIGRRMNADLKRLGF